MIHVVIGTLADQTAEAVIRPIRSDLAPMTEAARDVGLTAGPEVEERLHHGGRLPVGGAVVTAGGGMGCSFLIHVVIASEEEPQTSFSIQQALRNGLRRAADLGFGSLALPPLGIGVGTMEAEDAAQVLVEMLVNHLDEGRQPLDLTLVVATPYEEEIFKGLVTRMLQERFPARN